ncbi:MAG: elongation factor G, partial [Rhodospirillaceae bacterium]|nr:elongation factor G [Rhodospirillaceae bacterium]
QQETIGALMVVDAAIVVCEAGQEKALAVTRLMKELDDLGIPYLVFVNKMDLPEAHVKTTLEALQGMTERPLVLREIPIREDNVVTGFIDLVSERAYKWEESAPSNLIEIPEQVNGRTEEERTQMLEALADFNDDLLEQLLEDVVPGAEVVYQNLTHDLQDGAIVPVFFGSAEHENGIHRLLKALRHETPEYTATLDRLGLDAEGDAVAQVFKTQHGAQSGKLSLARIWRGEFADSTSLNNTRISGIFKMFGAQQKKQSKATPGEIVALGRLEGVQTGDTLSVSGTVEGPAWPAFLTPVYALSIYAGRRDDEVKMATAMTKIIEEDPSLSYGPNIDTGQHLLRGQGETHLRIALDRLKNRNKLDIEAEIPHVAYKESIRDAVSQHARHKKQSGGHGQFGDVHVDIKPLPRGSGFQFTDSVKGGVVPRNYIPAVEHGVKDYLVRGPLGFPVVDVAVELTDGQHHAVDSSDQAFKTAGSLAMREGMPKCKPVLLEPIFQINISAPQAFTSKVQRLISGRRGQILGFEPKLGWKGWDEVSAHLPESETLDLINELRSLTQGTASYEWQFDRLQEFTGKEADQVVAARGA